MAGRSEAAKRCTHGAEVGGFGAMSQGMWVFLEAGKSQEIDSPWEPSEETSPVHTWDVNF